MELSLAKKGGTQTGMVSRIPREGPGLLRAGARANCFSDCRQEGWIRLFLAKESGPGSRALAWPCLAAHAWKDPA